MTEKDTRPPDSAITAWARLIRRSRALLDAVETDLKAADLPPLVWYDILLELNRAGPEGVRPYRLQKEMLLAQYNMSRLVDRMATDGVLVKQACADDGRGFVLIVTAPGQELRKRMWPVYAAAIDRHIAAKLTVDEQSELSRLLGKL